MGVMEIVTGSTGTPHVTSVDDAIAHSNMDYLNSQSVFNIYGSGSNFPILGWTANNVRIGAGYGMMQGRLFKVARNDYVDVSINSGNAGEKRADLIVARYGINTQTGVEDMSLVVIQGQGGSDYVDPDYEIGNINQGGTVNDFPLYRVKVDGISIGSAPEPLFEELTPGGVVGELDNDFHSHITDYENPHQIAWTRANALADISVNETLKVQFGKIAKAISSLISHIEDFQNPHRVTKSQVGLGNVDNTSDANKPISSATATALGGKAPTNHAVNDNTYGLGTSSVYGHVKLSDSYNPTTASDASKSIGASQKAVKDAYQALLNAMGQAGYGDMFKATYDTNNDGIVDKAEKLNTARKLKVNLASTSDVTFDGSANQTSIGVNGTLPATNGGTGKNSITNGRVLVGGVNNTYTEKKPAEVINLAGIKFATVEKDYDISSPNMTLAFYFTPTVPSGITHRRILGFSILVQGFSECEISNTTIDSSTEIHSPMIAVTADSYIQGQSAFANITLGISYIEW